jgi:hypothetical protein
VVPFDFFMNVIDLDPAFYYVQFEEFVRSSLTSLDGFELFDIIEEVRYVASVMGDSGDNLTRPGARRYDTTLGLLDSLREEVCRREICN